MSYVVFMVCFINEESDVVFFSERRIFENYFGIEEEVFRFYKSIGKDVVLDLERSYLVKVFEGVNEYSFKGFYVYCVEFVYMYFDSLWIFVLLFVVLLFFMFVVL